MGLITKNGQVHFIPTKKGKQKGLITKNGQVSTLIPYIHSYRQTVMGVAPGRIASVMGVDPENIEKVNGT